MQVKEVMSRNVRCVGPDASLREAACAMKDWDVGPLPVCDNDRLAGLLTDRDIAVRAVAEGKDPQSTRVRDVMTPGVVYCFEDDDVQEAARLMEEKQIRRLLVLNPDKRLTGIVSLGDLAVQTGDRDLAGKALEEVSR
jgi:CBS domain-containing protein